MSLSKPDQFLLLILRIGGFGCFAGWAWVQLYWEGPYGILFWSDETFALAESFGVSWEKFVGTGANDGLVQTWLGRVGWLYLVCAVLTLTVRRTSKVQMVFLMGGSGLLVLLSYAKYLAALGQLPMFIEHGGQMLIPVILVLALSLGVRHRATVSVAIVAVIMIFAGHGAYAVGYHWPTPANFIGMTTVILHVDSETAKVILQVAGILDFVVCFGLFIPMLRRSCAMYAAVWGFLTALARPVAGMSTDLIYWGADQYLQEAILRAPHYMLPLYLFFLWRKPLLTGDVRSPNDVGGEDDNPQMSHS